MGINSQVGLTEPRKDVQMTLPDGRTFEGALGTTVETFFEAAYPDPSAPLLAALVDGDLRELSWPVRRDCLAAPVDLSESDGVRIYRRSLTFLMITAIHRLFPGMEVFVDHSLPFGGYFCETPKNPPLTEEQLRGVADEMRRLIELDVPIQRERVPLTEAIEIFAARNELDKAALFQTRTRNSKDYLNMYNLEGYRDYFHGYMAPSTGYLRYFSLLRWGDGFILQFPRRHKPRELLEPRHSPQLITVFREYGRWLRLLGVENVSELNDSIAEDRMRQIVLVSEALHEQRISDIAGQIWARRGDVRVVLIAGPSSSGKTTFSRRLAVQLLARGLRPFALELDNYFVNREATPRDANGEFDFEALEAVDLELFNLQLQALLRGDEVRIPRFNFKSGQREEGKLVKLGPEHIIIVEGIHGLNPRLVYTIPWERTFRIFASALTQLNLDRHNRVPTTDTRLIRRIVRDARTRGYSATDTLARWESVRRGEKNHIFPNQEYADVMFNSALVYELAVLKPFVEPLLLQVDPHSPQRVETKRLFAFLQWFQPVAADLVPENSILREFIGGQALEDFHWD
ncbi:MAG: Uridine kinase [Chloroflexi bacterium ADurb.Bin360]|nr:MAG: Uridine kinase [Chloroflexi bacterium ADurb.Bin360]